MKLELITKSTDQHDIHIALTREELTELVQATMSYSFENSSYKKIFGKCKDIQKLVLFAPEAYVDTTT